MEDSTWGSAVTGLALLFTKMCSLVVLNLKERALGGCVALWHVWKYVFCAKNELSNITIGNIEMAMIHQMI